MNKIVLGGALGRDPEVRYMPGGDAAVKFSVATTERWRDRNSGEMKSATEWHTCIAYGKLGENIAKFFTKGSGILLEGKLRTRKIRRQGWRNQICHRDPR
ncbi:single-stranded DNA-binding protein [Undibacterium arcticum]